MGSYNEFIVGTGKNKQEAFRQAWDEYVYENGHRCSFRGEIVAKMRKKVPPIKPHTEMIGRTKYISSRPDPTAPQSEWLEEWEFEIWVHS